MATGSIPFSSEDRNMPQPWIPRAAAREAIFARSVSTRSIWMSQ
jgi:hypothetical protein